MNCKTFTKLFDMVNKLKSLDGTNSKIDYVRFNNDCEFQELLVWLFDTSKISGIAEKKWDKITVNTSEEKINDFLFKNNISCIGDIFAYLEKHNTGSDKDVEWVKTVTEIISYNDEEKEMIKKIVCKNLPLGIDAKGCNKAVKNLIPTFDVCLCDKYYDKPELVDGTKEFAISTKIDGNRCVAIKENGNVKLVSRQGKLWLGCKEIEDAIKEIPMDNFVLDGEITIKDFMKYPSKDVYKMTTKLISTKDEVKEGLCLNVFDYVPLNDWNKKDCDLTYTSRQNLLKDLFRYNKSDALSLVKDIYIGKDVSKIEEFMKGIVRTDDWEGLVIKFTNSKYEWKRSKNWLKVKSFDEMDLIVKNVEEGTNSNEGRLGALICEIEHPTMGHIEAKVGSGYSEDERIRFWNMKDELVGRVISCQYFEQTVNTKTNVKSLRFPVFLELKEEGQEPNN